MDKRVQYWIDSANHDFDVAESLFKNKKYDWCLFVAHLVLEKILKGFYVKYKDDFPPRSHDLVKPADMADLEMDEETLDFLDSVNSFNISTRYPDEKFKFYKMCTKNFTKENLTRIKEIRNWLLQKISL